MFRKEPPQPPKTPHPARRPIAAQPVPVEPWSPLCSSDELICKASHYRTPPRAALSSVKPPALELQPQPQPKPRDRQAARPLREARCLCVAALPNLSASHYFPI
ncbi:unnamed protein product [Pleuronectes platessa]|uniref:Uncharacterized protein n=1 Tax=Pleuronectes platessa TaxID=8262 RepID=A0A9N7YPN0_PLEPL|nr:unnamed protein product [Pleuronectes platessa]